MSTFDNPFSTSGRNTETEAESVREHYDLRRGKIVAPEELAECMPVEFSSPRKLGLPEELLVDLELKYVDHWDAATLPEPIEGRYLILINESRPPTRIRVTRMEELLHLHFGHRPTKLSTASRTTTSLLMRTYNKEEERQAYSVGAALLVPWREICFEVNRGITISELATRLSVSERLIQYRINTTGLTKLYRKRQSGM